MCTRPCPEALYPDGSGARGRYGLRPEEPDSEGRYVGELHRDGRQGVELQGSEVG
jgi:hypothetical protein